MRLYRLIVTEPALGVVKRERFNAATDLAAERIAGDAWNAPYSIAEPGRYRLKLYRSGERRPFHTIG
jgi:hypothetical protein